MEQDKLTPEESQFLQKIEESQFLQKISRYLLEQEALQDKLKAIQDSSNLSKPTQKALITIARKVRSSTLTSYVDTVSQTLEMLEDLEV